MKEWILHAAEWLAGAVLAIGYPGIVLLMAIESSFVPFPSEVVVPPAGYLAAQGKMNLLLVILAGIAGSLIGAYVNYAIAVCAGRPFILRYGKYFLITEEKFARVERFFHEHGEVTTFVGRLIPAVRQLVSFPAGLARMNLATFTLYTALGAGIWTVVLALLGWWVGRNEAALEEALEQYKTPITVGLLLFVALVVGVYVWRHRRKVARAAAAVLPGEEAEPSAQSSESAPE